ncbi:MAG: AAA family ATPase [Parachlamydiaceae bacterium]|nr:AAA family ATPase [Parachlamydiaceae bacterium]
MRIRFFLLLLHTLTYSPEYISGAAPKFIFITGGSASGKTTFAKALVNKLGEDQGFYLSLDEYLDKRVQPESDFIEGIPNFDNPSMINWKLLKENLNDLQSGLPIEGPVYDFSSWMPVAVRLLAWKPVVIIEGIHSTQDNVDMIDGMRIFLDVNQDLRYKRRVFRDVKERNYTLEMIEKTFFKMAVPFQKIFLEPTRHKANIIIHSLDGEDYLEKAITYVINTLKSVKPAEFKNIKLKMSYQQGDLVVE